MDRLPVFKALGDNTRYAIYLELARSAVPLSTGEIADALELHPNTVRPHLERMRDAGLLDVDTDRQGLVGRPQHRYSLAADAPSLGLEPSAFRLLARLVAGVAARAGLPEDEVAGVGRDYGRALVDRPPSSCVAALEEQLAGLGFDPATMEDGDGVTVAFTRCPFRELAEAFPDVVCHLHRGMVEGIVEAAGGGRVRRFGTLADRDPCQVDLVPG
ncbi:MAG TPA: helix-turn-helix domain-containing protein [Acidimicrobiales bacterium]